MQQGHGRSTCGVQQVGDDLEAVALINEELLPLGAVVHLLRVLGHQGIEESIVLLSALCTCMQHHQFYLDLLIVYAAGCTSICRSTTGQIKYMQILSANFWLDRGADYIQSD